MVYFIVSVNICKEIGRQEYDDYIVKVKPIVERYGGRYLVRSECATALSDEWQPDRIIVIEWDSREQLDICFRSAEYELIRYQRENFVKSSAVIVEGLYENNGTCSSDQD